MKIIGIEIIVPRNQRRRDLQSDLPHRLRTMAYSLTAWTTKGTQGGDPRDLLREAAAELDRPLALLDEETTEWFTDVMVEKLRVVFGLSPSLPMLWPDDTWRDIVRLVIVDTDMLSSGVVSRERWEDREDGIQL